MKPFKESRVAVAAHSLTLDIYGVTRAFPREEIYGLTSQMRRSAESIPTNVAEGSARGDQEFHQFLRIALGSAAELEYQLFLSHDLGYIQSDRYAELDGQLGAVKRMLVTFMKTVSGEHPRKPAASGQRPTAASSSAGDPA